MISRALLLVAFVALAACTSERYWAARRWFAADGGVTVGTPERADGGSVSLPLAFAPAHVTTRRFVRAVEARVEGEQILVRVEVSLPGPRWAAWDGLPVPLGDVPAGVYDVRYLEPDGHTLSVASVEVPR